MINTPSKLKELCESAANHPQIKKLMKVAITPKMYELFTAWQWENRFPSLLGFRQGASYFMVRVR